MRSSPQAPHNAQARLKNQSSTRYQPFHSLSMSALTPIIANQPTVAAAVTDPGMVTVSGAPTPTLASSSCCLLMCTPGAAAPSCERPGWVSACFSRLRTGLRDRCLGASWRRALRNMGALPALATRPHDSGYLWVTVLGAIEGEASAMGLQQQQDCGRPQSFLARWHHIWLSIIRY